MLMACVNKIKWLMQLGGKDILAKIKSSTTESMTSLRINRLCSLNMLALLHSLMQCLPPGGGANHLGEKGGGGLIFGLRNFFPRRNQCSKWKKISASTPLFTYKQWGGGGGCARS